MTYVRVVFGPRKETCSVCGLSTTKFTMLVSGRYACSDADACLKRMRDEFFNNNQKKGLGDDHTQ